MERKFYKELWELRFRKMLDLEKKSVVDYQGLLDECKKHLKNHSIVPHLEKMIADEKRHAKLVEELQRILARQSD